MTSCTTQACFIYCMQLTYPGKGPGIAIVGPYSGVDLILQRLNLAACNFWPSDNGIYKKIALSSKSLSYQDLKQRIEKIISDERIIGVICNEFTE